MTARVALVQTATLRLERGQDEAAPGAAVTAALCGHWEHDGPCRCPHHTSARRVDGEAPDRLELRVVANVEPLEEETVRAAIVAALATGELAGPDRVVSWDLVDTAPGIPIESERSLAARLDHR